MRRVGPRGLATRHGDGDGDGIMALMGMRGWGTR